MKQRILIITILLLLLLCFPSCKKSIHAREEEAKREAAYNDGYEVGYVEGYVEGKSDAKSNFEDEALRVSWNVEDENGMSPDDALQILTNYADGEPITEEKLHQAIWAINQYYWRMNDAIHDRDSYD